MQDHLKPRELTDAELDAVAAGDHVPLPELKNLPAEEVLDFVEKLIPEVIKKSLQIPAPPGPAGEEPFAGAWVRRRGR